MSSQSNLIQLFEGLALRDNLISGAQEAFDRLLNWDTDALLSTPETDIVTELLDAASFTVPDIDRDGAYLDAQPTELAERYVTIIGPGQRITTRHTLVVPITGPVMFFRRTATRSSFSNPIFAQIDPDNPPTLLLHCDGMSDGAQIRAHFDRELDRIQERLAWTQADVTAHNQRMQTEVPKRVAARRDKLLADRNIQASIGFPIKRRDDADLYSVPLTRRTIRPHRSAAARATNPYRPEPALDHADYEAALAVLHSARNMLERSPSMTSKMNEQEIRDLLLVMLNGHFEGKAGGEVFNCTGKTDILIREQDRHVFIAECKVVTPRHKQSVETVVTGALDQLLGYLTWRDTKAALLLFVRDTDMTTVTHKAIATIRAHTTYKRDGQITAEERHVAVLHAVSDPNREIHLAFLPIHVGGTHDRRNR